MATTQNKRLMQIATPLAYDYLLINRISVTEGLSKLFSFELELLHEEDAAGYEPTVVDAKQLLGQGVTITVDQRDEDVQRHFNGMVNQFSQGNRNTRFSFYYATVVPHVWILTQNHQSRIFQHKSVPDILKEVLKDFEVSYEVQGNFKPRNYVVQYNESDFDFVSRLMEEEGFYYFFEHGENTHKMIIANTPQSHPDCPYKSEIAYFTLKERPKEDFITTIRAWQTDHKYQSGKVTYWDYHFQTPNSKLEATQNSLFSVADNQKMEIYEFPAGYAREYDDIDRSGGERADVVNVFPEKPTKAEIAMHSLDSQFRLISAVSDCSSITAGYKFKFTKHVDEGEYVITNATHEAEQNPSYVSDDEIESPYSNNFSCISYGKGNTPYHPVKKTPKPVIYGSQTATVVGPPGEEIFTDKFGRVKVQFHWDREGQVDIDSSCWIRVAQSWAGNKWGGMFIPRIGMEVIVHFFEGDPDQPIITGCVYNPDAMPPYTLPDEKTKSTIKSNSTKGGGGFNEYRIEDKKGEEQIFVHAEKDQDIRVKNDRKEIVLNDRHLIVGNDKLEKIGNDKHIKVVGDHNEQVDSTMSLKVGSDLQEKVGQNYALDAGMAVHIKAGMTAVIEAGTTLTLKVGGNFININSMGIFVKGSMVMLNSGGMAGSGAGASPEAPKDAKEADNADPGDNPPPDQPPPPLPAKSYSPLALAMKSGASSGAPFAQA